jgi:hypothetical protein
MTTRRFTLSRGLRLGLAAAALALALIAPADAGGPLLGIDGKPVRWAGHDVRGGPLDTQTVSVDGKGRRTILYRVDSGPLGSLTNQQGLAFVDRIFREYTEIPTADISFQNAGPILDPDTGQPVDVDATNFGKFFGDIAPFQNPIIFDSDGAITGSGGVLGFFSFLQTDENNDLTEASVVLNGSVLSRGSFTPESFLGVFTHEFGHFAGPLDHAQINGNIAWEARWSFQRPIFGAKVPDGFTPAQAWDLFAPFTETMFPFIFAAAPGSTVGFPDDGYFIASLDTDTKNALSALYPTKSFLASTGAIEGGVFIKSGGDRLPMPAMNVVARRIDRGLYPPAPGTVAFPSPPPLDADGIPAPPPGRRATDSLATVSSAVTGLNFGLGGYRIPGLPLGLYQIQLQQINPFATGGSAIGPFGSQFFLPVVEEYFNGRTSSNDVRRFFPVPAVPGFVTPKVDLYVNGLDNSNPKRVTELKPNFHVASAKALDKLPARVQGSASVAEPSELTIDYGGGSTARFQSFYAITVPDDRFVFVVLQPTAGSGDLDLAVFLPTVDPFNTSLDDPNLVALSAGNTADEVIGGPFGAGNYIIGVSAFEGSVSYKLYVIPGASPLGP